MRFTLEALNAKHGDALLLHYGDTQVALIDAGPAGVYESTVEPRLLELRDALDPEEPLPIELAMVSHIDDDHIHGIDDLFAGLADAQEAGEPQPCRIRSLWLNQFDDIVGNHEVGLFTDAARGVGPASSFMRLSDRQLGAAVVASVPQGQRVRDAARRLNVDMNGKPFEGLVLAPPSGQTVVQLAGGLELVLVAPNRERVENLQEEWDAELQKQAAKKEEALAQAAAYLDNAVPNLSSIVVLARVGDRSMLLTGDARGDHILEGLGTAGLLDQGKIHVDVLKLPHHGSDRNVDQDFFDQITADHYVVSADGRFGNPDVPTLEMISKARPNDDFTIHVTNTIEPVSVFFEAEHQNGRQYRVVVREEAKPGIRIDLGDPLEV